MVLMPLLSRLLTLLVILTMPLFLARLTLIPIKSLSICFRVRSEERFSRNAETDLVCRLLLEKKKLAARHDPLEARRNERVTELAALDAEISRLEAALRQAGAESVDWGDLRSTS